tara:strand:+ start:468 stop:686 length:219 start_codon:yes stop_codon:yes gene_type:complete
MIDVAKSPRGSFDAAVATAAAGDEIIYHVGEFAGGAHRREAYAAYEAGKVVLVQKRVAPKLFRFVAVRTKAK